MNEDRGEVSANPMSDLEFDWIAVLHAKAEGVHAYGKYLDDARRAKADRCVAFFEKLRDQDMRAVRDIKSHVEMMMAHQSSDDMARRQQAGLGDMGKPQNAGSGRMSEQEAPV